MKNLKKSLARVIWFYLAALIVIILLTSLIPDAKAQEVGQQGGCLKNRIGQDFCAPPGGGIMLDWMGQPVCGRGQCLRDKLNRIVCSSQPNGYATLNSMGIPVCTGGCEFASSSLCEQPHY